MSKSNKWYLTYIQKKYLNHYFHLIRPYYWRTLLVINFNENKKKTAVWREVLVHINR